jgi:hypothetical protein
MFRSPAALALFGALFMAASPLPAPAQLVPRLVDYPVTRSSACTPDGATGFSEIHRVTYAGGQREDALLVFNAPNCPGGALLFTVSMRPPRDLAVTPTAAGSALLHDRCASYDWKAGVEQAVSQNDCALVAPVLAVLQR